ncbi:MAG: ABC transporter ATP-binding protein [Sulfurimonas sp.]|uniref:ABC transporter ATP-binding protein n=1 Tax=Sulfurimonas sp. TaxID=2022749 RepID=UPI0025FB8DAA|nr:ABC transporter ATP-binding protein [Sulfurimonas sp.]MCK9492217.1 ABC transporter ATP-binding protein [Sulfurimonas sp.]
MIKLDSLNINYNDKNILKEISLEIGGHLNILGANGSGKSTLAKTICGLVEYNGEVYINEKNIRDLSLKQRAKLLTYVPTKLEVYDEFINVEEFVLLGRFAYKDSFFDYSDKDKKIAKNTLEFLNISHLGSHTLSSLSSGEAQLVSLASALVSQSEVIILDEPTANLDPHNAKTIAKHIKGLKKYHQIILITHDLDLASYIDSPTIFLKSKSATYFEKYEEFYNEAKLKELYEVEFDGLVVRYD